MSQSVTRISLEEFSRDAEGILKRLARTGESVEIAWDDRRVALVPVDPRHAPRSNKVAPNLSETWPRSELPDLRPPSAETVAQRREVSQRANALRQELLDRRGGAPAPSNAELIKAEREARARELEERWR